MVPGPVVNIYPLSSYTFGAKEAKMEKDTSVADRLARMKQTASRFCDEEEALSTPSLRWFGVEVRNGFATSVLTAQRWEFGMGPVCLVFKVQEHNHPHILLLQIGNTFFKLPGGRLKPGEDEVEGLKRKLSSKLALPSVPFPIEWQVGECAAMWWRPNFETLMYPYCPPHITKAKECKKLFVVHLPERHYFAVPKNLKLLAVPLFELYDNVQRYGPVMSAIPQQLSRFNFKCITS
eukprot:SM000004S15022  [mRNA]  locus=s4:886382:888434:+ [translate_table: standard]